MAHVSHTVKDWQRNSDQLPDYKPRALSNSTISILVVKPQHLGTSLAVQGLGLPASTARGLRSIPGQGTKIPLPHGTSKKKKTRLNTSASATLKAWDPPSSRTYSFVF